MNMKNYVVDNPIYAVLLPDGTLATDNWDDSGSIWITLSRSYAEKEAKRTPNAKAVLYSSIRGDDFPVLGGQPLPEDLMERN